MWERDQHGQKKIIYGYRRSYVQLQNNIQRVSFLSECVDKKFIPNFLKFRIPSNGCFNHAIFQSFQSWLSKQELKRKRIKKKDSATKLQQNRSKIQSLVTESLWPSIWFHVRWHCRHEMSKSRIQLLQKLHNLCSEHERPELNIKGYLTVLDNISVPQIVEKVLRYGPGQPVQMKFYEQHFVANNDILLSDC